MAFAEKKAVPVPHSLEASVSSNTTETMRRPTNMACWITLFGCFLVGSSQLMGDPPVFEKPWRRHVIDNQSRGADGTRMADVNGDGRPDIATGWEQGGITRVYLNPGPNRAKLPWPAVTVGKAKDVEDAVLMDVDRDGSMDVISSCEGGQKALLVHWAPKPEEYANPEAWKTEPLPASQDHCRWMFATPMDVDLDGSVDLVAGGKGPGSQLGWWKIPDQARNLGEWRWHPLLPVQWLMSLESVDMNGDGRADLLFTDRKGDQSGCYWLEHPGTDHQRLSQPWPKHVVGAVGREAMFLQRADLDRDGLEDVVLSVRPQSIVICRRLDAGGLEWREQDLMIPMAYGSAKAPAIADFTGDGRLEIAFSTERAADGKMGLGRLINEGESIEGPWVACTISGVDGIKHDLINAIDLDDDGDLDLLTCEEAKNLGVIWYENPVITDAESIDSIE